MEASTAEKRPRLVPQGKDFQTVCQTVFPASIRAFRVVRAEGYSLEVLARLGDIGLAGSWISL